MSQRYRLYYQLQQHISSPTQHEQQSSLTAITALSLPTLMFSVYLLSDNLFVVFIIIIIIIIFIKSCQKASYTQVNNSF